MFVVREDNLESEQTRSLLAMHLKTPAPKGMAFFKDEAYFDGRDLI